MTRPVAGDSAGDSFWRAILARALRSPVRLILSIAVTVGLIAFLLRLGDPQQIYNLLASARPQGLVVALATYTLVYLARTWRFRLFNILSRVPRLRMFSIAALHALSIMVLPARTGELTLIYLLRRYEGVRIGRGAGVLLVSRLYDLLAVALFGLGALGSYQLSLGGPDRGLIFGLIGLILALMVAGLLLIRPLWGWTLRLWRNGLERAGWAENRLLRAATTAALEVEAVLREASGGGLALQLLLTSIVIWVGWFGTAWALLGAMGFGQLSFAQVVIGSSGGVITGVLPINAVGNWGTMQADWTAGFYLFGVSAEDGIATGFAVQIYVLLFAVLFALVSTLAAWALRTRRA